MSKTNEAARSAIEADFAKRDPAEIIKSRIVTGRASTGPRLDPNMPRKVTVVDCTNGTLSQSTEARIQRRYDEAVESILMDTTLISFDQADELRMAVYGVWSETNPKGLR